MKGGGEEEKRKKEEISENKGEKKSGQMTAGGWMYIGQQESVHGTNNTLLNAGRLKLGVADNG
ncbi:hypothetical protein, partial [Streptococcus pyogenes]|uniref:hypothetical protein n=1 Tax=Streptococcus pyogenes TaxID=1314 RepID=UPI0016531C08